MSNVLCVSIGGRPIWNRKYQTCLIFTGPKNRLVWSQTNATPEFSSSNQGHQLFQKRLGNSEVVKTPGLDIERNVSVPRRGSLLLIIEFALKNPKTQNPNSLSPNFSSYIYIHAYTSEADLVEDIAHTLAQTQTNSCSFFFFFYRSSSKHAMTVIDCWETVVMLPRWNAHYSEDPRTPTKFHHTCESRRHRRT